MPAFACIVSEKVVIPAKLVLDHDRGAGAGVFWVPGVGMIVPFYSPNCGHKSSIR